MLPSSRTVTLEELSLARLDRAHGRLHQAEQRTSEPLIMDSPPEIRLESERFDVTRFPVPEAKDKSTAPISPAE